MKTLTCKEMGGPCDTPISAETKEEMMSAGMAHLKSEHPEMAADIEAMPKDDPKMMEWGKMFEEAWEKAPMA
jgi:predicted small metal-binding protein